ncbi:MAG: hypothetical protein CMJ81_13615 [Planctomycetaceae bacterium]|nr:hypothetical protein [Planctomycetaceae bacterium]
MAPTRSIRGQIGRFRSFAWLFPQTSASHVTLSSLSANPGHFRTTHPVFGLILALDSAETPMTPLIRASRPNEQFFHLIV